MLPQTIVWGDRVTDPARVVRAELVSIAVTLVAGAIVVLRLVLERRWLPTC